MNEKFRSLVESLEPSYQELIQMTPVSVPSLPREMPSAGIYLFSEGDKHLYVGRTNRLRERLQEHCQPGSDHYSATFAFRLAREATGNLSASYTKKGSRSALEKDPEFQVAFTNAKERVRRMQIRFVSEAGSLRQALLEIYISVCLETPHNDFDTH